MRKGKWREKKEGGKGVNEFDAGWFLYLPGTGREAGAGTAGSLHFGRAFCRLLDVTPPLPRVAPDARHRHRVTPGSHWHYSRTSVTSTNTQLVVEEMQCCIHYNYKETSSRWVYMFPNVG